MVQIKISKFPSTMKGFFIISDRDLARPIGFFGINQSNELVGLYLEEEYRKKGYGKKVLNWVKKKFNCIVVTGQKNTTMQKLLKDLGYTKYLKYEYHKAPEGRWEPNVWYCEYCGSKNYYPIGTDYLVTSEGRARYNHKTNKYEPCPYKCTDCDMEKDEPRFTVIW